MKEIKSGVYQIRNMTNAHRYIGSSSNIEDRFNRHKRDLLSKKHHSIVLQRAWDKYGKDIFAFELVENCEKSWLINREQHYTDLWKPEYSIRKICHSNEGIKRSEETRRKLSESHKGIKNSYESRLKMSTSHKGIKHSVETKLKMRKAHLGRVK